MRVISLRQEGDSAPGSLLSTNKTRRCMANLQHVPSGVGLKRFRVHCGNTFAFFPIQYIISLQELANRSLVSLGFAGRETHAVTLCPTVLRMTPGLLQEHALSRKSTASVDFIKLELLLRTVHDQEKLNIDGEEWRCTRDERKQFVFH